jgi:hypothetical protein
MFELSGEEFSVLRSQIVTSKWGGLHYCPFAFFRRTITRRYVFFSKGLEIMFFVSKKDLALQRLS